MNIPVLFDCGKNLCMQAFRQQIAYPEVDSSTYDLNLWYDVSAASTSTLTLPEMHMRNVDYEIPIPNLFIYVDNSGSLVCLAMGPADDFSIIGNIQQRNNLIVFDVANQRVGFQATQCDM